MIALTDGHLSSYQPGDSWPDGARPADLCPLVREVFPDAAVGGGVMTNSTEMNRSRPDPECCDVITHANTPIVHAGDDMSVLEPLETLPQIFASAKALSGGMPCLMG